MGWQVWTRKLSKSRVPGWHSWSRRPDPNVSTFRYAAKNGWTASPSAVAVFPRLHFGAGEWNADPRVFFELGPTLQDAALDTRRWQGSANRNNIQICSVPGACKLRSVICFFRFKPRPDSSGHPAWRAWGAAIRSDLVGQESVQQISAKIWRFRRVSAAILLAVSLAMMLNFALPKLSSGFLTFWWFLSLSCPPKPYYAARPCPAAAVWLCSTRGDSWLVAKR